MSYHAQGKEPPRALKDDPSFLHRWQGLSVYDTYEAARNLAASRKWRRWHYIGVLHIPEDTPIIGEGPEDFGHWNLYGATPAYFRDVCLVRVVHAESTVAVSQDV